MGVYDFVIFEPSVLPNDHLPKPSFRVSWQTREFRDPMYRLHCVSDDGSMYRADHNYDSNGLAESGGETGSFEFLNSLSRENYNGYPRKHSDFKWFRVRFVGNLRVTAQLDQEEMVMYDVNFERQGVSSVEQVTEDDLDIDDVEVGDTVYDRTENSYEIVEVINERADEFVVKPETVDRGHVIYEERTVADLNQEFPNHDRVIKVRVKGNDDRKRYFPVSRLVLDPDYVFS